MTSISSFTHEQIQLPSGSVLEASLSVPLATSEVPREGTKLAVCLHPWSWLGGNMDDPVLRTIKGIMLEKGYYVLRYNTRGAGRSSGWPSLTGFREAKDLQELVQWALATIPSITSVVIMGYSYGSLIASLFPLFPESTKIQVSHILLSYPLGPRSWLTAFRGEYYASTLEALIRDPRANILVIYGDRDDFTGFTNYDGWASSLRAAAEGDGKGRLEIVEVENANHFWADHDPRRILIEVVDRFLR